MSESKIRKKRTPGQKAARQLIICAVVLLLVSLAGRLAIRNTYYAYIALDPANMRHAEDLHVRADDPSILSKGDPLLMDGYLRVPVNPEGKGSTYIYAINRRGTVVAIHYLEVLENHVVRDLSTGGFSGDFMVIICVTLFCFLSCAIMTWHFFQAKGSAFYDYSTIYFSGFSLFALVTAVVMLNLSLRHLVRPAEFSMLSVYSALSSSSWHFLQLTTPLILAFAVAMIVSNIALLRHMTPRIQNGLGIIIGVMMIAGAALAWYFFTRDFSGSEQQMRIASTFHNVYATIYIWFECMLAGSAICALKATKVRPSADRDFIIILGCAFRKDGTLPPLLRGRVDRAISFWREQKEQNGREAVLIPSGGQGRDETMPEAEAMKRYLLEQGIPDGKIRPEDQSRNTYENMLFSGKIMDSVLPEGKAVFSTTNYHVFRSGIWAARAGVDAEGIGSRTKWWFWPNAFMRECLGLMKHRWKSELLFLVMMILFFATLTILLG